VASAGLEAPGHKTDRLKRNRLWRLGFFFVGLVLFYAPFALVARLGGLVFPGTMPATWVSDVHVSCLRMPVGWLTQPWLWGALNTNPLYYVPIVMLPLAALAAGPLFCGWLCPAGAFPEFLSRLVPDRFKWDPKKAVEITAVRYGFFVGFLIVPFVAASICCSFCNFTWMQNIVSATTGNVLPWLYVSTTGVVTLLLWIFVLGIFTKGGRGWCLFLCPAGSLMSLVSGATSRIKWLPRVRHEASTCTGCSTCAEICPVRAIDVMAAPAAQDAAAQSVETTRSDDEPSSAAGEPPRAEATPVDAVAETPSAPDVTVNQLLCNVCLDCVRGCPSGSFRYGTKR